MQLILAWLHLLALAIGMGAVWARAHALRDLTRAEDATRPEGRSALRAAFAADTFWGIAAGLWLITGLARAFGPVEKGTTYYFSNAWFLSKMAVFVVIVALEIWPMITLIRWRRALRRGAAIDSRPAREMSRISTFQAILVAFMVLLANAMARGYGSLR